MALVTNSKQDVITTLLFFGFLASTMVLPLYRYRFASTPRQRQQTRWVVLGISIAVVVYIASRLISDFILPPLLPGSQFLRWQLSVQRCVMSSTWNS